GGRAGAPAHRRFHARAGAAGAAAAATGVAEMNTQLQLDSQVRERLAGAITQLERIILGKGTEIRLCLACLFARGHLLIEDIPGVGKTTLAHALARTLGLTYQRIQFTSDLLPADVIGVSIFD